MKKVFKRIERKVLVRKEVKTNPKYKVDNSVEAMLNYSIVNINKPASPTSHQTSHFVKKILGIDKAGHSGTLDPNVTGVLPTALGRATKVIGALLHSGKEYICLMHVHKDVDEKFINETSKNFIGKIQQIPPLKSSVKRQLRIREIYYLDILEIKGRDVLFRVGCQAGTYIRKLCDDWGKKMKTGAHMAQLRRTRVSNFTENSAVTLQELKDAFWYYKEEGNEKLLKSMLQPIEKAVFYLPKIWVLDTTVNSLCHGADLKVPGISKLESDVKENDIVAIMTLKEELVGLGTMVISSEDVLKRERGLVAKIDKVFMLPGIYPKIEKR